MVDDGEMTAPATAPAGEGPSTPSRDPDPATPEEVRRLRATLAAAEAENRRLRQALVAVQDRLLQHYADADRLHRETIRLDEHFANPAFYFVERLGPERPFHWMGQEREAWFATNIPRTRALKVELIVEVAISESALEALEVHADGVFAARAETEHLDNGAVRRTFFVPAPAEPAPYARTHLGLIAGERIMPAKDERLLAVGLSRIEIAQIDDEAFAAASRWHMTLPAAAIAHAAFYPCERRPGDDAAYRWFGAEPDATFLIAPPRGRPIRVAAHLVHQASETALADFRIAVDDRTARDYTVTEGPNGTLVKAAELRTPDERLGPVRLRLSLGTRHEIPSEDGPRQLGVALERLVIEELSEDDFRGPGAFRCDIDAPDIDHPAFYWLERLPNGMHLRWLGQEDEASLDIMVPGDVPLAVSAELVLAINEEALENFHIGLDGTYAEAYETLRRDDGRLVHRAVFAPLPASGGALRRATLSLKVGHKVDLSEHGDPRTLAVALRKIVIEAV